MSAEFSEVDLGKTSNEGPINRSSSIGPGTAEVRSMKEQVERSGRPTTVYEFAQGMVDYGSGKLPPPRIFLVYNDGRREIFAGKIIDRSGITAVEFTNSGGGLRPEETTTFHHEAEKSDTLGQHGRGTTIALTYLASEGMRTEIESSYQGKAWKVATSLENTDTRLTQVLRVDGAWLDEPSNSTVFRVMSPTGAFLDQVDRLPEYFLPANSAVPDASIVERSAGAQNIPLDYKVTDPETEQTASVRCLAGVVPYTEEDENTLYVDGLKVQQRYSHEKNLFPWAIAGARDLQQNLKVSRSSDSGSVDGRGDVIGALLQIALRHNENPEIFTRLLTEAEALDKQFYEVPLELNTHAYRYIPDELKDFSEASKALLSRVWREKHEDAYVASSAKAAERFARNGNAGTAVAVKEPMYSWLKESGIQTVEDVGVVEGEKVKTGNDISVEYADDADRLEKLFLETGQYEGMVEVVTVNGKKGIKIGFPYSIHAEQDFSDRHKPAAQLARVAAIIAQKEGLQIAIRSQKAAEVADLEFDVTEGFDKKFGTKLEVLKSEGKPLEGLPNGLTVITLTGDSLQGLNPPRAKDLKDRAERATAEAMRRRAELAAGIPSLQGEPGPQEQPSQEKSLDKSPNRRKEKREKRERKSSLRNEGRNQRPSINRRRFLVGGAVLGAVGVAAYYSGAWGAVDRYFNDNSSPESSGSGSLSNEGYNSLYNGTDSSSGENQIGADYGGIGVFEQDYRNASSEQNVAFEQGSKGQSVDGYYRQFVGSKFVLDNNGRGRWISVESYQDQSVPVGKPREYSSKIAMANIDGRTRIPIRDNERIVAMDSPSSPVAIKREKRTGDYIVDGSTDRLVAYTTATAPNTSPPLPVESESMLTLGSLSSDWQSLLVFLQGEQALTNSQKAALVLTKWSTGFTYTFDTKYDALAAGKSSEQVATQIVNGKHGICNYSATGIVGLFREAGVPARQVAGEMVGTLGNESVAHAWAEFWNGKYWVEVEPLIYSKVDLTPSEANSGTAKGNIDAISGSARETSTQNLLTQNQALVTQYKDALKNQASGSESKPQTQKPKSSTPESSQAHPGNKSGGFSWKDIGEIFGGILLGAGGGAAARRRREKPEERKQPEEEGQE